MENIETWSKTWYKNKYSNEV